MADNDWLTPTPADSLDEAAKKRQFPLVKEIGGVNLGNIRSPRWGGFKQYPTEEIAARAIVDQWKRYKDMFKLKELTIASAIKRYSPPNENRTKYLVAQMEARTGFGRNQPLNLDDPEVAATISHAVAVQEGKASMDDRERFRGFFATQPQRIRIVNRVTVN